MSRYTAGGLLPIPLGIAMLPLIDRLGFPDKAKFSLMCHHTRRLLLIEPTSRDIDTQASTRVVDILVFRYSLGLPTGFVKASLIGFNQLSPDGGC